LNSGAQDSRLLSQKGQPRIEMFTKAFVRAGRFTTQFTRLDFDTKPMLGFTAALTIPRKGQLLSRLYLVTTLPDIATPQLAARKACDLSGLTFLGPTFGWTNSLGHALLTEATLTIGGSRCERLDGRLLEVLDEFYTPLEKTTLMNSILPRKDNGFRVGVFGLEDRQTVAVTPLPFWFSSGDSGAFLPIDAIQADSVVLNITYRPLNSIYVSSAQQAPATPASSVDGEAYFPMAGGSFYYADSAGKPIPGLLGSGTVANASPLSVKMAQTFTIGDTYVMAEYIYLDRPEANRFRLADLQIPIPQHYPFDPFDTQLAANIRFPLKVPNPTRSLFFYLQRWEARRYNAPFLATRDLSGGPGGQIPWWPDASGLNLYGLDEGELKPGFSTRESEPLSSLSLVYEGKLVRYWTDAPSMFRSLIPSTEMRKSPWVNRYMYAFPFGFQNGHIAPSFVTGEANLDKIMNVELALELHPNCGSVNPNDVPRYFVYVWAETYNILRVYGGRAGLLFGY
jgi:hypothetical protein